ncbi:MAG: hypothetical protein F6K24_55210 [Okeania sp. SIO2D1]|nr:hypothetical protein [Okeania sp. SIO2D1]
MHNRKIVTSGNYFKRSLLGETSIVCLDNGKDKRTTITFASGCPRLI